MLFFRHLLKAGFPSSYLSKLTIYALFTFYVFSLCLSTFVFFTFTSISWQHSSSECWIFHNITRFSVSFLMLVIMCSPFPFFPLFSPLRASCVSLINLYHSLVNCLTFTSCGWGACSGKWNGSAVLQGQIHPLVSSPSFFPRHPFISLPFTRSAEVESPSKRDIQAKLAGKRRQETSLIGQEKQETSQHLPQEVKSKPSLRWAKNAAAASHPAPVTVWQHQPSWCRIQESTHCDSR